MGGGETAGSRAKIPTTIREDVRRRFCSSGSGELSQRQERRECKEQAYLKYLLRIVYQPMREGFRRGREWT